MVIILLQEFTDVYLHIKIVMRIIKNYDSYKFNHLRFPMALPWHPVRVSRS